MAEWYTRQSKANLAAHIVKQEADLAADRAEIERLTKERDSYFNAGTREMKRAAEALTRAEKAEAERDEARAQVAMAFVAAADKASERCAACGAREIAGLVREHIVRLTPADAQSALEAYGREKVREGMRMAAKIADQDSSAYHIRSEIRAEMETLK